MKNSIMVQISSPSPNEHPLLSATIIESVMTELWVVENNCRVSYIHCPADSVIFQSGWLVDKKLDKKFLDLFDIYITRISY